MCLEGEEEIRCFLSIDSGSERNIFAFLQPQDRHHHPLITTAYSSQLLRPPSGIPRPSFPQVDNPNPEPTMSAQNPPRSTSEIDLASLPTPPKCTADFCLIPIGTPTASVSGEIAEVQRLLKRSGVKYSMHSAGTTLGAYIQASLLGKPPDLVTRTNVM